MAPVISKIKRAVSLARALSKLGYTSRSQAEKIILEGRVSVNSSIVKNPSFRCSLETDVIAVDNEIIGKKKLVYIMMNKPAGVVTTRFDELGRKSVYDLLGKSGSWVFPVGRLDKETSGLLLLTNDNRFGEQLTNPKSKVPKTYLVQLDKHISDEHAELFRKGMMLNGEKLLPANIVLKEGTFFELTIVEGKNRQIRRMCETCGYEVKSLVRIKIGNYSLRDLKAGSWKFLTQQDIERITDN